MGGRGGFCSAENGLAQWCGQFAHVDDQAPLLAGLWSPFDRTHHEVRRAQRCGMLIAASGWIRLLW